MFESENDDGQQSLAILYMAKKVRDILVCYFISMNPYKLIMSNYYMRKVDSKCNKK